MKTLISTLAVALALAFTGPAFAGDVTKATDKASCDKAGGVWDDTAKKCSEKKMYGFLTALTASGTRSPRPFLFAVLPRRYQSRAAR